MDKVLTICNRARKGACDYGSCEHHEPKFTEYLGTEGNCGVKNKHVKIIAADSNNPNFAFIMKRKNDGL